MIRTRFSPSPTGHIHIGNARSALFSALFALNTGGQFLLRIEDTDKTRSEQKYTHILEDDLHWLGIDWQEGPTVGGAYGPYFQSERQSIYDQYYKKIEESGVTYPCFCTDQELAFNRKLQLSRGHAPRYLGTCRNLSKEVIEKKISEGKKPTLRLRVPDDQVIEFVDLIKGPQRFQTNDIGDFIIRRADGTPPFLFCNAIDDSLMEITHVIRGEDHLANTPRQLMILQFLNLRAPSYGHLSMILDEQGGKLSKRMGSSSLGDLRTQGYLPIAVLNYLARLSHAYEEQRLMSLQELAEHFHLDKLSRAPARFDEHQLLHWQKEAVLSADKNTIHQWLYERMGKKPELESDLFIDVMQHNILFPEEAEQWIQIITSPQLVFSEEQIAVFKEAGTLFFEEALRSIKKNGLDIKKSLDDIKQTLSVSGKKLFQPVRIALTGLDHGPELIHIAHLLGVEKMLQRVQYARDRVNL